MDKTSVGQLAIWRHPVKNENGEAWARVLLVHGVCEQSWRHRNTIKCLTGQGLEVVRFDLRGHGESGGERQWIKHFHDYVDDVAAVQRWIMSSLPKRSLFLLGHSLGGAIAIYSAAEMGDAFRGLLLNAPAFELGAGVSRLKIVAGKIVNRVAPHVRVSNGLDLTALSRDPEVAKAVDVDPLCCRYNTVHQAIEILNALAGILAKCKEIKIPVLLTHGDKDRIIAVKGSQRILEALASTDKTLDVFPGGFHETHNDLCKDDYFKLIVSWMKTRA